MRRILSFFIMVLLAVCTQAVERQKINFNAGWELHIGDLKASPSGGGWEGAKRITLPYAFNGDEAFRKDIVDLTDTVVWYRKVFKASPSGGGQEGGKYFIEFEGARQGADVYLNGHHVGFSDNGVMAFGFDLTPYIIKGENVLAVRCDNSWQYRDRTLNSRYQWNDRNFNANYGGLPKNVWLHITDKLYQTLPLYSNLGTTGTYVYATDIDVQNHKAVIHAESQVRNDDARAHSFTYHVQLIDANGHEVARFQSAPVTMQPGETRTVSARQQVGGLHFWSWGYGYLYTVKTSLKASPSGGGLEGADLVITRTGFRKTRFGEGKIWLNDRCMMVHGYAQRTSNEWPGVGLSVPAWLSDYSNGLMVESGGNMVRWMHVTPWKQDVESCDRVGLPQAMPAGDAEKDVEGARWQQRTALMRDAIIYNRNNPSILFYECGNESISREHMLEMKAIRDAYDPHGGRAIGSREMLDIDEAEYGGEMLYINKSRKHPMWAMEYCRDEGLRKYWDEWSYPYHREGDGPLYRGNPAREYNHNMDQFAIEMVRRWYDYWRERPGTGTRVSSGGVKIVFSDTNTHHRGESNYRTSGVTDAMRIPKDAFFAHQVMWNGWVEPETPQTYIIGHWSLTPDPSPKERGVDTSANENSDSKSNHSPLLGRGAGGEAKSVYVISTADSVELFLNGRSLGRGRQSYRYLFTFDDVHYEPGVLEAVGSDGSRYKLETAGEPHELKLTAISNPEGTKADGADMVLVEVEVVDKQGRRCPLDNRMVHFELWGEGRWIGGIATGRSDNYVGAYDLPLECGVNRVLVRSTANAGDICLSAYAEGVRPAYMTLKTQAVNIAGYQPQLTLKSRLERGETPAGPSYRDCLLCVSIVDATAGSNPADLKNSYDDNELSEWKSDGILQNAWVKYTLSRRAAISEITLKLTGWRQKCYPLAVYAGKKKVWEGITPATLGYVHLSIDNPVAANDITIRMVAPVQDSARFGQVKELAGGAANEMDRIRSEKGKVELRIVELDLMEKADVTM